MNDTASIVPNARAASIPRIINGLARYMRLKLEENALKPPWRMESDNALIGQFRDECRELVEAVIYKHGAEAIAREAADVANLAAMLADNAGAFTDEPKPEPISEVQPKPPVSESEEVARLRAELAEVTADRDRWVARMKLLERFIDRAVLVLTGRAPVDDTRARLEELVALVAAAKNGEALALISKWGSP
ncbi:MAG TPA: hypothetical protein VHM19_15230 [Polyangiales bacterium]|jgi:hypothetical protein|nr:hypothetical protein [Polyangiales bacterium]